MFARQPCDPIPRMRDVGQWLCVPPFRVVCLYQACLCSCLLPRRHSSKDVPDSAEPLMASATM